MNCIKCGARIQSTTLNDNLCDICRQKLQMEMQPRDFQKEYFELKKENAALKAELVEIKILLRAENDIIVEQNRKLSEELSRQKLLIEEGARICGEVEMSKIKERQIDGIPFGEKYYLRLAAAVLRNNNLRQSLDCEGIANELDKIREIAKELGLSGRS